MSAESGDLSTLAKTLIRGRRILIVDDSRTILRLLTGILKTYKAILVEAINGQEAMCKLQEAQGEKHKFDLIITDIAMPEMDGVELLRNIRHHPNFRTIPVIVHSTQGDKQKIIECARFGVASYILKPSTTERILEATIQALQMAGNYEPPMLAPLDASVQTEPALNAQEVKQLKATLVGAAEEAYKLGRSRTPDPNEDTVVKTVLEFLDWCANKR